MDAPIGTPLIRRATRADFLVVREFYLQLIEDLEKEPYHPLWRKGVYPNDEYLQESIEAGELWVAVMNDKIAAAMVVNNRSNEGYMQAEWGVDAAPGECTILHTLGVGMNYQRQGIGAAMIRWCIELAGQAGHKAVRLDLIDHNLPAAPVYTKLGFRQTCSLRLYYDAVGWQLFHMFEYEL